MSDQPGTLSQVGRAVHQSGGRGSRPFLPGRVALVFALLCGGAWSAEPTYHGQIIRLLQDKCIKCHHDGGIGPTDWSDYDLVVVWKDVISAYVTAGIMPPWLAAPEGEQGFEPGQGFLPNNELTQEQIDVLVDWIAAGTPEGDPADAPPPLCC